MRYLTTCVLVVPMMLFAACAKDGGAPLDPGTPGAAGPTLDSPTDDQLLTTVRPTLTVVNSRATAGSGARKYEFQLSPDGVFDAIILAKNDVPEGTGGKTSITVDQDLPSTTRLYWRARLTRGDSTSDWSPVGRFRTKPVGRNISDELFDPLTGSETVGTIVGSTTFIPGRGIQLNDQSAYIRYALPDPVANGEFSMEVEGLRTNAAGRELKIFQIASSASSNPASSTSMINAQYRGRSGNPDNSVSFRAVLGSFDPSATLEPDSIKRNQSVINFDPSHTYFWQGIWTDTTFGLVIKDGGVNGAIIYDYTMTAPGGNGLPANPLFAFVGANSEAFAAETGTFPGMIVRNVWVSSKARPASVSRLPR